MKRVIDADNNKILEYFKETETSVIKEKYENIGNWEDISIDVDGDIILWEEI